MGNAISLALGKGDGHLHASTQHSEDPQELQDLRGNRAPRNTSQSGVHADEAEPLLPRGDRSTRNINKAGCPWEDPQSRDGGRSRPTETTPALVLQILVPFLLAGLGTVSAGMLLDLVQVRTFRRFSGSNARAHITVCCVDLKLSLYDKFGFYLMEFIYLILSLFTILKLIQLVKVNMYYLCVCVCVCVCLKELGRVSGGHRDLHTGPFSVGPQGKPGNDPCFQAFNCCEHLQMLTHQHHNQQVLMDSDTAPIHKNATHC